MPFPDQCIPVKGFFPESAKGIEDSFVLVSLDADLYDPIYAGLHFFFPRLVKGGYILIHDFNNDNYKGARKAVEQFCSEQGLNFVPLPDSGGSAIIANNACIYSLRNENSFRAAFLEGIHEANKAITMTVTATSKRSPIFNVTG